MIITVLSLISTPFGIILHEITIIDTEMDIKQSHQEVQLIDNQPVSNSACTWPFCSCVDNDAEIEDSVF